MAGRPSRVTITGPLVPYFAGFRAALEGQGYRPLGVCGQLRLMAHLSRWLDEHGFDTGDLVGERVEAFLLARRAEGYTLWLSPKAMAPLLAYLRSVGVVPAPPAPPVTPTDEVLIEFRRYLLDERGVAPATAANYLRVTRLFLAEHFEELDSLSATQVLSFVSKQCAQRGASWVVCGLRAFLRWGHVAELIGAPLADAVPPVARRRLASLPMSLKPTDAGRLLGSCDRRTTAGLSFASPKGPPRCQ